MNRLPTKETERSLARQMGRCIADYSLIEDGDRIMVCLSGGKDSYALLHLLMRLQRRAPIKFEIVAVHVDQKQPGYDGRPLVQWLEQQDVPFRIIEEDTYSIVVDRIAETKTYCALCSRLRRGVLYNVAESLECTKLALGHHRDDAIETLMMNMMFNGSLSAMPAKWRTIDERNTVIRPLLYIAEAEIASFADAMGFPILPCNLCGSQQNLWRQEVKSILASLENRIPQLRQSMLGALKNVHATHLLDTRLCRRDDAQEVGDKIRDHDSTVRLPLLR